MRKNGGSSKIHFRDQPLTTRLGRSLRMAHGGQARLVAEDPPGDLHGDRVADGGGHSGSQVVGE